MPVVGVVCRRWRSPTSSDQAVQGVIGDYIEALSGAGASVVLVPLQSPSLSGAALRRCDGLLLAGGETIVSGEVGSATGALAPVGDELRDEVELSLFLVARMLRMPVLGICRGLQVINVALGGTVGGFPVRPEPSPVRHASAWDQGEQYVHDIAIVRGTLLEQLSEGSLCVPVNGYHTQCVHALATSLRASAYAPDGVVEALEAPEGPLLMGVQWHPECLARLGDPLARQLVLKFVEACLEAGRRPKRRLPPQRERRI